VLLDGPVGQCDCALAAAFHPSDPFIGNRLSSGLVERHRLVAVPFRIAPIPGRATVTEPSQVVFLSYASQDAAAALQIANALRVAGIDVWLDQSALRGGDVWDRHIQDRIRGCRLFIALISTNTEARDEGYFRREWNLAVERTHSMSERKAFLVPVVIDNTPQRGAAVPDKFRDAQWTQLPGGETPPEFIAHIARLLSLESSKNAHVNTVAPEPTAAPRPRAPSSQTREHQPRSIAVLPFANLSSDREQEYFSDGLTEELINQLAHVRGLRVLARTSSFAFKGKNEDLRVIGQKLAVGCIVEGSVRRAGNRLRITAQLINCSDGYHLWSATFDRELEDVFAIQNDISQAVANALGTALGVNDEPQSGGTRNIEAYERYLRALSLSRLIGGAALQRSIELYREALALDPDYALAWAGLAAAHGFTAIYSPQLAGQSAREQAHAAERALAIAPHLWASRLAYGGQLAYQRKWSAAIQATEKAVELAPASEPRANFAMAIVLQNVGRLHEALVHHRAAIKIDPLSLLVSQQLQLVLTTIDCDSEAEAEYTRSFDLAGDRSASEHVALQRACRNGIRSAEFHEQLRRFLAHDSVRSSFESELPQMIDDVQMARARLHQAFDDPKCQDPTRQFRISWWAALFADSDLAFAALRRAVDMRSGLIFAIWLPAYATVRKDPRFKQLLRDLNIVDCWRATANWGDFARPVGAEDFEVW
jgi:TolB-like protein